MSSVIVVFKKDTPKTVIKEEEDKIIQQGGTIGHRYGRMALSNIIQL